VIAATGEDNEALKEEAADLLFHLMVLLQAKGLSLSEVSERLWERHRS
jgi:phosphoribosyl-ATP pyrophosphohydrolase